MDFFLWVPKDGCKCINHHQLPHKNIRPPPYLYISSSLQCMQRFHLPVACASKIKVPKITSRRHNPWLVKARDDPVLLFGATIPWHIFYPPKSLFWKLLKDLVDQEHLSLQKQRQEKVSFEPNTYNIWGGQEKWKFRNKQEQPFVRSSI